MEWRLASVLQTFDIGVATDSLQHQAYNEIYGTDTFYNH